MKPKKPAPIGANTLDAIEWLNSILPDTPEMQAIEEEEWAKFHLATALTKAREAAGYTQVSLAKKMDVRQSLISKWEKADHNHTVETLLQICQATGAKLVMALEMDGQVFPITHAAKPYPQPLDTALLADASNTMIPQTSPYKASEKANFVLKLPAFKAESAGGVPKKQKMPIPFKNRWQDQQ